MGNNQARPDKIARISKKRQTLFQRSYVLTYESMSLCASYMGGCIAITVGKDAIHSLTNSVFEQFTGNLTHEIASIRGGLDDSLDNVDNTAQLEESLDTAINAVDTAIRSLRPSPQPTPVPRTFEEAREIAKKMALENFNKAKDQTQDLRLSQN